MTSETLAQPRRLTGNDLWLIFLAGVVGEIVLEFLAWVVFPNLVAMPPNFPMPDWVQALGPNVVGMPMQPHILVTDLGRAILGLELPVQLAMAIHLALGFFIMPYVYVKARAALGIRSWVVASVAYGVMLWLIAQSTLAPIAGRPIFLGFIGYTWGSLVGHVIYTVAVAWTYEHLRDRFATR